MDNFICSPESMGISSYKLIKLVNELSKHCSMHDLKVVRNEKTVLECCWAPFDGRKHVLNSFAKSVNVLAVGMAVEEGLLSLEDKPAEMFKDLLPEKYDPRVLKITVRDLLRMTSGSVGLSTDFNTAKGSWITHYFSYPVPNEPGTKFMYESGASFMLSAMVSKVYGKTVFDLLSSAYLNLWI